MDTNLIAIFAYAVTHAPAALLYGRYEFEGYGVCGWPARLIGVLLMQAVAQFGVYVVGSSRPFGPVEWPAWFMNFSFLTVFGGFVAAGLLWAKFGARIQEGKDGDVSSDRGPVVRQRNEG